MISNLDHIREMFAKITAGGWNVAEPLQYGYFFFNSSREPLEAAERWLSDKGYRAESYHQTDGGTWVLQLSKIEIQSAESLHKRNQARNDLAEHFEIDLYHGWDVGKPAAPSKHLPSQPDGKTKSSSKPSQT
jgi:hypothetical protein